MNLHAWKKAAESAHKLAELLHFLGPAPLAVLVPLVLVPMIYNSFQLGFSANEHKDLLDALYFLLSSITLGMAVFSFWRMCMVGGTWLKDVASHLLDGTAVASEQLKKWIVGHAGSAIVASFAFVTVLEQESRSFPGSADGGHYVMFVLAVTTLLTLFFFILPPLIAIRTLVRSANKALQGKRHHLQRSAMTVTICMALMSLLFLAACFVVPPLLLGLPVLGLWFLLGCFALQLAEALS